MDTVVDIAMGLASGTVAGVVFFSGLRWTVARLADVQRPALLATVSFFTRSALLVALLVIPANGSFIRIIVALGSILVVRTLMVRSARRDDQLVEGSRWI